jgi:hypothetical protein
VSRQPVLVSLHCDQQTLRSRSTLYSTGYSRGIRGPEVRLLLAGSGAAFFFWLAFYEYTKARLSKHSVVGRNSARICGAVVLAVVTIALVHGPNLHFPPVSDLRIVRESTLPFQAGESPKLSIWMMNDSPYTMIVRRFTATAFLNAASSREVEKQAEPTAWNALRDKFERIQKKVSPYFYPMELPPKIETAMTLNQESPTESIGSGLLTEDQAKVLQQKGGSVVVIFASIFA